MVVLFFVNILIILYDVLIQKFYWENLKQIFFLEKGLGVEGGCFEVYIW